MNMKVRMCAVSAAVIAALVGCGSASQRTWPAARVRISR